MMAEACPISFETINEKVARVNAALTVLCMLVFVLTPFKAVILILGADLFIRGFLKPGYSFFSLLSRRILRMLKAEPTMTNAGPKIFAAKTGFVFTGVIGLLYWLGIPAASYIFAAILALFAFLEAVAGFCVACRLYPFMPDFIK
jgi:hypothetical protein